MANYRSDFSRAVFMLKALADENRLRIFLCLKEGELCVCRIIALLDLAPSTISKHLLILKQAGLIESSKRGKWIHYRRSDDPTVEKIFQLLSAQLVTDELLLADSRRLEQIEMEDAGDLCRRLKLNKT
jgi:ArsR family transcriptional regulator